LPAGAPNDEKDDTESLAQPFGEGARRAGRARRVEVLAVWVAGLLLASPVLVAFYPPMTDLAFHEGAIGILRYFGDTSRFPPGLYRYNLGEPNQLFHMLAWALSYVVSTRWAVKLVVAAAVALVPVSAARFATHVGASPLAALVVAPMALGWLFSWGLVANVLGLAALLLTLPLLDRLAEEPTPRRALAAVGGGVLLYFAHEAMLFVYGGTALGLALLHRGTRREAALRLAPMVAGAVMAIAQMRWQKRFMTPAVRAMPTFWHTPWHKLKRIPYLLMPAGDPLAHAAMFALCVLALGTFLWLRTRERRAAGEPTPSLREHPSAWALAHRWELFSLACFVAYMAFPLTLGGATLVYQRWFPPAFAVLALVLAPRDIWVRPARVTRIAVAVLPVATLLVAWPAFADSSRQYEALEAITAHIEPGSAVASVDLGPGDPSRNYSLGPAAGRVLAERGGRLVYAFTDSPVSPVVLAKAYQWNESLIRVAFDSWAFRPAHDFQRFRYLVLRTTDPMRAWIASYALADDAEYVDEEGEWVLFRSRHDVAPLTSPDWKLEKPPPDSMREKLSAVTRRLHEGTLDLQPPEPPEEQPPPM
jgi:hypothetical protein